MSIAFEVDLAAISPAIRSVADDFAKITWGRPLKETAEALTKFSKDCFDNSHAPDMTPWAPLKRERMFPDKKNPGKFKPRGKVAGKGGSKLQGPRQAGRPLRNFGILMASLTGNGRGHIEKLEDFKLTWGTNIEYAAFHQFGAYHPAQKRTKGQKPFVFPGPNGEPIFAMSIRAYNVPARPFLGITEPLGKEVDEIFLDHIERNGLGRKS